MIDLCPIFWRLMGRRSLQRQYDCFLRYSHKRLPHIGFEVNDPSLVVLTIDVSKVTLLNKQEAKTDKHQVWTFAKAVYEALPKTWTIREFYEDGSLFALKFVFSIGDGMSDWVSHYPLYRLERLDDVPLTLNRKDRTMEKVHEEKEMPEPCVLDRALWDSICKTLNSDSFKKKAFPHLRGNA